MQMWSWIPRGALLSIAFFSRALCLARLLLNQAWKQRTGSMSACWVLGWKETLHWDTLYVTAILNHAAEGAVFKTSAMQGRSKEGVFGVGGQSRVSWTEPSSQETDKSGRNHDFMKVTACLLLRITQGEEQPCDTFWNRLGTRQVHT